MSVKDYHDSILDLRLILESPKGLLQSALKTLVDDLKQVDMEIQELLRSAEGADGQLVRRRWLPKQAEVRRLIVQYASKLSRQVDRVPRQVAEVVSDLRETATLALIASEGVSVSVAIDFSAIPNKVMEILATRIDVEGLKLSPKVWGDIQADVLLNDIRRQLPTKSLNEIARGVRQFVQGADALSKTELKDLRLVRGKELRRLGHSIKYKAERLIRTEVGSAAWEAGRLSALESPVVLGVKWNVSERHPKWDVCDILAEQDLYGLGSGVYPPDKIPVRPHPHDQCFQTDVLRPAETWNTDKPLITLTKSPQSIPRTGKGTKNYVSGQRDKAIELIDTASSR